MTAPEKMEVDDKPEKGSKAAPSKDEEELSEEDQKLKDELEVCVARLTEDDSKLWPAALENLRRLIRASTTSMTAVPKPLKFMIPHYEAMVAAYRKIPDGAVRRECADILSVLAMTSGAEEDGTGEEAEAKEKSEDKKQKKDTNNQTLEYKLLGNSDADNIVGWGHEYVRHLSGEIVAAFKELDESEEDDETTTSSARREQLLSLVKAIAPAQMRLHADTDAIDLVSEVGELGLLEEVVDETTYRRVCLYLTSCVPYVPDPENVRLLETALNIFRKFKQFPQALRLALQLNRAELIKDIFLECPDELVQKQLAYMLGRHHYYLAVDQVLYDEADEIMSNTHLSNHFLNLARELDIMEPKTPEDVYKTHLDNVRPLGGSGAGIDSARANLASSFVNGFVNAGFGKDKLLSDDGNKWLYKNKEHGMMSATASIGLILLWDVDGGLTQIDKYLYSPEDHIKSGALLATGIVNCRVRNECDPALALLSDYVKNNSNVMRIGAVLGLGLAYAGFNRAEVLEQLLPVFGDPKSSPEVVGVAALSVGLIAVGSTNGDVVSALLETLIDRADGDGLKDSFAKFLPLGIGLCFLGKQDAAEATIAALEVLSDPFKSMAMTLVDVCAYAGTGNVLKIQNLLHICSEHYEPPEKDDSKKDSKDKNKKDSKDEKEKADAAVDLSMQQSVAVLGLALIAMGEDIGSEMLSNRTLGHLMRYCEPVIRRAVPLALGLLSVSNPQLSILDTLNKFSHDSDAEVAHNAIFAMGLLGAGTNNARLAAMLRQLAQYHAKDSNNLFMVRIAQGLVHMGKGTLTLNPTHSDGHLLSPAAVAGLLGCVIAFLDVKSTILGKSHYLLYCLVAAMQPRMLVTFDEQLQPLPVSVRVGQAVDVVGQAGKPKTITGFQTHTTPVLLACGERAELATEDYTPLTPIMEGFVILRKNE